MTNHNNFTKQLSEYIFPMEAKELIFQYQDQNDLVILDVSTKGEFSKFHLDNAMNISLLSKQFKSILALLDKDKTYLVYCKAGGRSIVAKKNMSKLGFKRVYCLVGGAFLWAEEGLPFAKESKNSGKIALCPMSLSLLMVRKLKQIYQRIFQDFLNLKTKSPLQNN